MKIVCESRQWKSLFSAGIVDYINIIVHKFGAIRSDNVYFAVEVAIEKNESLIKQANIYRDAIKKLESYRNCKCDGNIECGLHKDIIAASKEEVTKELEKNVL